MLKKGSKLNSILTGSCPKCQNESMYVEKNVFKMRKLLTMYERCGHCGFKYQIEPSFFYGAMYVSYALNVALGVATFVVSFVFFKTTITQSLLSIFAVMIVFFPVVIRLSRNIYINLFVDFDANA
jgi:uncharacterized protein (DUF983 family)